MILDIDIWDNRGKKESNITEYIHPDIMKELYSYLTNQEINTNPIRYRKVWYLGTGRY